jgi:transposase
VSKSRYRAPLEDTRYYGVFLTGKREEHKIKVDDKAVYKERNRIERLFCRIKARFRKVFTRYDKLDVIYLGFVHCALIVEMLQFYVNTP